MFIAALLTIAKRGKKPKCPGTDEWIKKMGRTQKYRIGILHSHEKMK